MHPIGVKLGSEKRRYPVGAGVGLRVVRVLQVISVADERLSRRGGCWVGGGGDACVAPGGGGRHTRELDEGDANVPTPHAHRSHPYGTTPIGVNLSLSSRAIPCGRPCPFPRMSRPFFFT